MSDITARAGDTFETVARRVYGTPARAALLRQANPGVSEPMAAGVTVAVPPPRLPGLGFSALDADPATVALLVDGTRFDYWTGLTVRRSLDAVDTITVEAPFEPSDPAFRAAFQPLSFKPLAVTLGGSSLFTGTMVHVEPSVSADAGRVVSVSGYSLPGVLNDCAAPAGMFDGEVNGMSFDGQNLKQIAEALAAPFGIPVAFEADPGAPFEEISLSAGAAVMGFLAGLARQRNIVISSTPDGALRFLQSPPAGVPVAVLREGEAPVLAVDATLAPQEFFSHVTAISTLLLGLEGDRYTVANPFLRGVIRPHTYTATDTPDGDIRQACEAKAGRMFGNAVSYTVEVATWRDPSGAIWTPGSTVSVEAPGAMIYSAYKFIIRTVELTTSVDSGDTARLTLVPPGAFSGQVPEALPWQE